MKGRVGKQSLGIGRYTMSLHKTLAQQNCSFGQLAAGTFDRLCHDFHTASNL